MQTETLRKSVFRLGTFLGIVYVLAGVIGGVWSSHWEDASTSDRTFWVIFLVGGGAMLLAGLWFFIRSRWIGAVFISLGSLAGALAIFWTVLVPFLALALVVLSIMYARRTAGTSLAAD